ncbi:hypothetical protein STEG23_000634, partial [Scotinomys teguina]
MVAHQNRYQMSQKGMPYYDLPMEEAFFHKCLLISFVFVPHFSSIWNQEHVLGLGTSLGNQLLLPAGMLTALVPLLLCKSYTGDHDYSDPECHGHVMSRRQQHSSPSSGSSATFPEPKGEFAGAGAASIMSALTDKAIVKKELLCDVAGRDKYKVNNKHDSQYTPLPPSKIIQIAEELVGKEVLYKLTSENCEHFVNEIRYGVARSDQMRKQKFLELKSSDFGRSFHPTNLSEFSNLCRVFLAVSCVANVGLESRDSRSQILSCSLSVLGTEPGVLSM